MNDGWRLCCHPKEILKSHFARVERPTGGMTMTKMISEISGLEAQVSAETEARVPFVASGIPAAQGLYHPRNEHDACGVGFIAHMKGKKSHQIVKDGLFILENLTHRGAVG